MHKRTIDEKGALLCADISSAKIRNSSLDFPFLPPPLPPVGVPLRFLPLPTAGRVGSKLDMALDSPRKNVASVNWCGNLWHLWFSS
jgi:hypothetical protein